jgi:hypothetical protein
LNFCNFVQHEGLAIKNNGFGLFAGTRRYAWYICLQFMSNKP